MSVAEVSRSPTIDLMWSRLVLVLLVSAGCRDLLGIEDARVIDAPRGPPPGDVGVDPDAATAEVTTALLREWSGCMSPASFTASSMSSAWANLATTGGTCQSCHAVGGNGFIASTDEILMFDVIATNRAYMLQFFIVDLSGGPSAAKVVVNTPHLDSVAAAKPPHDGHPTFPVMNAGMTALSDFHDRTRLRKLQGTCDPPRLAE